MNLTLPPELFWYEILDMIPDISVDYLLISKKTSMLMTKNNTWNKLVWTKNMKSTFFEINDGLRSVYNSSFMNFIIISYKDYENTDIGVYLCNKCFNYYEARFKDYGTERILCTCWFTQYLQRYSYF
jgi:hypothetical protein